MFKQLLHMPELLRSPGQTLCTPVPADHIILAPSPCGLCNSIPASYRGVVSTKRTLSRTCSGSRRLHERTCNVRLQHARACSLGQASPPRPGEWESPYYFGLCIYIRPRLPQDMPSDIDNQSFQECGDKNLGHGSAVPLLGRYSYGNNRRAQHVAVA